MSFIRPEARAGIRRWREALAGGGALALGLWWALGPGGLLGWVGWGLVALSAALIVIGLQRGRFRAGGGGPGVVQVDEGRIAYFGPLTGGAVAASDLVRLELDRRGKPAHWVLEQPGQPPLYVPVNAEGAEALFDAFSALPGLRTERMLAELAAQGRGRVVIWQRGAPAPSTHRLH
ncbi:MAG: hypothetical protein KDK29_05220 [Sedimentitalea sp.]|nr:hypothetical protein [Sedimentitalea sp.]